MLDIGLSLGWAAGGPVSDPGAPTNAPSVADPASALALAGAFRDLVDAFAAGESAAVAVAPVSGAVVDASDGQELPAAAEIQPTPVECPPVVSGTRTDVTVHALPGAASTMVRRSSIAIDAVPPSSPDEADVDDDDAVVVPVVTAVEIPKTLPIAALSVIPAAIPTETPAENPTANATTIADAPVVATTSSRPAAPADDAAAPPPVQRSNIFARELPRPTGGQKSADNLPVAEDAALGPDVTDSAQRLPPARPSAAPAVKPAAMPATTPVAMPAALPRAAIDLADTVIPAGLSAPALTRILAAISEAQSSGDQNAPVIKTAAALRIAAELQSLQEVVPATPESQTNESFGRDASQQPSRTPAAPLAKFVLPGRATAGIVIPENRVRSSTSAVLPASVFSPLAFSSLAGAPMALTHLSSGGLQTLPLSASAMAALGAAEVGPRTADQIMQSIRLACSRDGGEAHIRLDPEQFGDLSVSVKVDGNNVVARLNAEAPAVREWLRANTAVLRDGLAGHDLRLDRLEVVGADKSRESSERDADKRRQQAYDQPQKRSKRSDTGQVFEVVA